MVKLEAAAKRELWLQERRNRLGATDVSAILGLNPYRTAYEVWLDKRGLLPPWSGNEATHLGQEFEPVILKLAGRRWGRMKRNVVAKHNQLPIAATLDGWLIRAKEVVEIKTAGLTNGFTELGHWGEEKSDIVPEWYQVQVQTQLLCTEASWARMLALISGRGLVEYHIRRDPEIGNSIAERCARWWNDHIVLGAEPDRDPVPPIEVLSKIRREPNSAVLFSDQDLRLVEEWQLAKAEASTAHKRSEELKARVVQRLGTAEKALLPDGRELTYLETTRSGYTVDATTYRTIRFRKAS